MELSPEEKKKIYEEEEVRVKARKEIKEKEAMQGCFGLIILILIVIGVVLYGSSLLG